jgi:hypothetical protein
LEVYPDCSSPTIAIHSIITCLTVAACNGKYTIAKIDVRGAFIQTEMQGTDVYIKCGPGLRKLIVKCLSGIAKYVHIDGSLCCKLLKALYGCVQASKLWFEKLTNFLCNIGVEHSIFDTRVMRRKVNGMACIIIIYDDDILTIACQQELDRIRELFIKEFRWILRDNNVMVLLHWICHLTFRN